MKTPIQSSEIPNSDSNYRINVMFQSKQNQFRSVPDIDFEEYRHMRNIEKEILRKKCANFANRKDLNQLYDPKSSRVPLQNEKIMDEFIKTSQIYSKYKDQPIICLGRSPKWFLNACLWMKDGIDDYKFVAFSERWYRPDYREGVVRLDSCAPTETEEKAYRKYLKRIKADPQSIVNNYEKTGKKTVITDYIFSGKGLTSFLDVMSRYADDLGVLEKFAKSFQIVGIGSMDYIEEMNGNLESYSVPRVYMPEKLFPYRNEIPQEFYDMNYFMFREMLINQNTNECRSTYYPPRMWTKYDPARFKTGLIKDTKKIDAMIQKNKGSKKELTHFTPGMRDYRNLLNFRILDALNARDLLKKVHHSKL